MLARADTGRSKKIKNNDCTPVLSQLLHIPELPVPRQLIDKKTTRQARGMGAWF
jgi:hypothetical protein